MYMLPYSRRNGASLMDLFDEVERNVFGEGGRHMSMFSTDIKDEGDHYLLQAELPGFQKEDIEVSLQEGVLTIAASREESKQSGQQEDGSYLCRERRSGSYSRTFRIEGIQEDAVSAAYNNGILELTLPKKQEVLPQNRKIAIQ